MKLQGKTILITGGSSGIGFEFASQLLASGNRVIVTGRNSEALDSASSKLSGLRTIRSDVSDPAAIPGLFDKVFAEFSTLDVLINNAGIMRNLDLSASRGLYDVTKEIDVNLSGPVRMIQEFLPHLLAREEALIVNVSSGLAFVPLPMCPVYSATKSALHSYTLSLRMQLRGTNVRVVELAPPGVETPLYRGAYAGAVNGEKGMNVSLLVRLAIAGIESGRTEIRPGLSNPLWLMSRLAPNFMLKRFAKMKIEHS